MLRQDAFNTILAKSDIVIDEFIRHSLASQLARDFHERRKKKKRTCRGAPGLCDTGEGRVLPLLSTLLLRADVR